MASNRGRLVSVIALLVPVTILGGVRVAGAAVPAGVTRMPSTPGGTGVTLITGDRVRLLQQHDGGAAIEIQPGPGRTHLGFVRETRGGPGGMQDITVLPQDAIPLVDAGRLDPRLFDVSDLARQGFTDGARDLPLIVQYAAPGGHTAGAGGRAASPGGRAGGAAPVTAVPVPAGVAATTRALPSINGAAVRRDRGAPGAFWRWLTGEPATVDGRRAAPRALAGNLAKVWLDALAHPTQDANITQIGAPTAWGIGLTGAGVTVGVLDTGIKADHPDLAGKVLAAMDFTGTRPDASDDVGHGTHVAGIIAGTGAASGGQHRGVAPDARLISGKVCVSFGCPDSAVIAGMQWIAPQVHVVNMSLGGDSTDGTDPLSQAVNALSAQYGTLFVAAAGNDRTVPGPVNPTDTVVAPAAADAALAVGSVSAQDQPSVFSPAGLRLGDDAVKPDIAAPGEDIVSDRAPGTPDGDADPVDANYARMSGTSMAAPHVSGAAAILLQQHPDWDAARLKLALMSTAAPTASVFAEGTGRLDVARAVTQPVSSATGSLNYGFFAWPHTQRIGRTVTYRNDGDAPVTLSLATGATAQDGSSAPAGLFTVSPGTVTVPAHGTADVTVTADTGSGGAGEFAGRLTATAPGIAVQTAMAIALEPESYNLTISLISRTGTVHSGALGQAVNTDTGQVYGLRPFDGNGVAVVRLPKARYDVNVFDQSTDPANPSQPTTVTLMSRPGLSLSADTSITLDARAGRSVRAVVDQPDAQPQYGEYGLVSADPSGTRTTAFAWFFTGPDQQLFAVPTRSAVAGHPYTFYFRDTMAAGVPGSDPAAPVYQLAFLGRGRIPDDPTYRVHNGDLAAVDSRYVGQGGGPSISVRLDYARLDVPGANTVAAQAFPITVPSRRTEYFTASKDVSWEEALGIGAVDLSDAENIFSFHTYAPGRLTAEWNGAPLGPAFGDASQGWGVARAGNQLVVGVPLMSDSDPSHYTAPPAGMTGTTELSRGGAVLGTSPTPGIGAFPIPDSPGTYTLRTTGTRVASWSAVGTAFDVSWTFHEPGAAAPVAPLPLLVVRARGQVDDQSRAPAGQPFPLALVVQGQPGAPAVPLAALAVQVSSDDGATWQPVPTKRAGLDGLAVVPDPAGGFVSLRITAEDADGNSVTQTVIRAYQVAGPG